MLFVFLQPESTNSPDNNLVSGPVISELIDQDYIPDTKQAVNTGVDQQVWYYLLCY